MKSKFSFLLVAVISMAGNGAFADRLDADGILRKDDGSIRYMTQSDAFKACPVGMHLPSVREQAMQAEAHGAKGIWFQGSPPGDYYKITTAKPDGTYGKVEFYFSHEGYQRPFSDLGTNQFWSSSYIAPYSDYPHELYGYFFDGYDGTFQLDKDDGYRIYAVRCVAGRRPAP